jgi:2,3-bisphosphoglycerate-independent phosphoglycerate mutase
VLTLPGATLRAEGELRDLAPTVLELLDLPVPPEMTGRSLLQPGNVKSS